MSKLLFLRRRKPPDKKTTTAPEAGERGYDDVYSVRQIIVDFDDLSLHDKRRMGEFIARAVPIAEWEVRP